MKEETKNNKFEGEKAVRKHFSRLGFMYFLGTLIVYGVQTGAMILLTIFAPDVGNDENWGFIVPMAAMYIIAMPLLMLLLKAVPARKITPRKMSPGQMALAFFMSYAILYVSNIIGTMVTTVIGVLKGSAVENQITEVISGITPWTALLFVVFCAPVFEELVFRKFLVERVVQYGEGLAVLLSGLFFGLFHGNLNQFAYAFTIGMFFAFIYVKTGKIIYSIILHMAINFMGSIVGLWILEKSGMNSLMEMQGDMEAMMQIVMDRLPGLLLLLVYFFLLMLCVGTGIVLLLVKRNRFTFRPGEIVIPKGRRFKTVILNLGMMLYMITWLVLILVQLLGGIAV